MDRAERAVELKQSECNCCQAVLAVFADELGMTMEEVMRLGACFGAGMGRMKGTCGALCAAEMILGMTAYEGRPMGSSARRVFEAFERRCGSTVCAELKGVGTGETLCSCDDCVATAVRLLEGQ